MRASGGVDRGRALLRGLLIVLLLLAGRPVLAQDAAAADAAIASVAAAQRNLRAIDAAFSRGTDAAGRRALQSAATDVAGTATGAVATLSTQMALADATIARIGPATPGIVEAPDIQAERRRLAGARSAIDSAIRRGRLTAAQARQLATEIADSAADTLSQRIASHTPSPLSPRFWALLAELMPRDLDRAHALIAGEAAAIAASVARGGGWPAILGLATALAILWPLRLALRRLGRGFVIERAPGTRLRRTALAFWIAIVGTLCPGLAATALIEGMRAAGMILPDIAKLAIVVVRVGYVAGAIAALGEALLQPKLPSWRLPPVSDEGAVLLTRWVRIAAGVVVVTAVLGAFATDVGTGGALAIAIEAVCVAIDMAFYVAVLRSVAALRVRLEDAREAAADGARASAGGAGVGAVALLAWVALAVAGAALLTGYVTLAHTVVRMMLWWPLVGAALYLMLIAADDVCTDVLARESRLGHTLVHGFGVRGSLVDQAGVALSAIVRLLLVALAISLAMGPFGSNVSSLLDVAARVSDGLTIGQITISPGAILRGLAVLGAGLFVVRLAQHWLTERYLPATELDAGARNSIATVARYTGLILVTLWALASLGIGIERIALLLSALSVGIGFGLQAITQNFVSGLILLAERPVKIGDWVKIGNDEGDIKRISVRATEIQIADKSTLIVPNSELITKAIVNKTLSDPLGRIHLQFSIPLGSDVARARDLLLGIYRETEAVLDDPAPAAFIDGIADGRVALNSFAHVASPRDVYATRSAILFRLLEALPGAGIELGTTPQQMQIVSDARAVPFDATARPDAPAGEGVARSGG